MPQQIPTLLHTLFVSPPCLFAGAHMRWIKEKSVLLIGQIWEMCTHNLTLLAFCVYEVLNIVQLKIMVTFITPFNTKV